MKDINLKIIEKIICNYYFDYWPERKFKRKIKIDELRINFNYEIINVDVCMIDRDHNTTDVFCYRISFNKYLKMLKD